jgi:hypothetical protein
VPSVALFTKAFEVLSGAVAKGVGFESLCRYVLPHPLNPLPEDKVRQVTREHMSAIVRNLVIG